MNRFMIVVILYLTLAIALYVNYNFRHLNRRATPPRRYLRFATPWYYHLGNPRGTWFFSFWDLRYRRGYPEIGIRVLGFEYWVEYWK